MDQILHFEDVLDFDLKPHSQAWTQGSNVIEWNLTLQGSYGQSMKAFW